jgi:hypothetical protein
MKYEKWTFTSSMYFAWIAFSSIPLTDFWASSAGNAAVKLKGTG